MTEVTLKTAEEEVCLTVYLTLVFDHETKVFIDDQVTNLCKAIRECGDQSQLAIGIHMEDKS